MPEVLTPEARVDRSSQPANRTRGAIPCDGEGPRGPNICRGSAVTKRLPEAARAHRLVSRSSEGKMGGMVRSAAGFSARAASGKEETATAFSGTSRREGGWMAASASSPPATTLSQTCLRSRRRCKSFPPGQPGAQGQAAERLPRPGRISFSPSVDGGRPLPSTLRSPTVVLHDADAGRLMNTSLTQVSSLPPPEAARPSSGGSSSLPSLLDLALPVRRKGRLIPPSAAPSLLILNGKLLDISSSQKSPLLCLFRESWGPAPRLIVLTPRCP